MLKKLKEDAVDDITEDLKQVLLPIRKDNFVTARKILRNVCGTCAKADNLKEELQGWLKRNYQDAANSYDTFLYNEMPTSVLNVKPVPPVYSENSPEVPGRQILRDNYDKLFSKYPLLVTFGEDSGEIGGVNQSLEGLAEKIRRAKDNRYRDKGSNNSRSGYWAGTQRYEANCRNSVPRLPNVCASAFER